MSAMRPSNAHIWTKCAGWYRFSEIAPTLPDNGPEANEGNSAHDVAANLLRGIETPDASEEMQDGAALWVETIKETVTGDIQLENIERTLTVLKGMEGTPDYFHWDSASRRLDVFDYKFGFVPIDVEKNPQLLLYANGVIDPMPVGNRPTDVRLHVVQPRDFTRPGKVRSRKVDKSEFARLIYDILCVRAEALKSDQLLTVGSHCTYCKVRDSCPALAKGVGAAMDFTAAPVLVDRSPASIGREWTIVKEFLALLKSRATGLEAEIEQLIKDGVHDTGYVVGSSAGKLEWSVPIPEVVAFGELMGLGVTKPNVKTPTQVLALLKKAKLPPESIASMSARGSGKRGLVPANEHYKELFEND